MCTTGWLTFHAGLLRCLVPSAHTLCCHTSYWMNSYSWASALIKACESCQSPLMQVPSCTPSRLRFHAGLLHEFFCTAHRFCRHTSHWRNSPSSSTSDLIKACESCQSSLMQILSCTPSRLRFHAGLLHKLTWRAHMLCHYTCHRRNSPQAEPLPW